MRKENSAAFEALPPARRKVQNPFEAFLTTTSTLWHAAIGAALGGARHGGGGGSPRGRGHAAERGHRGFAWMRAVSPKGYKYTSYADMVKQMDHAAEASTQAGTGSGGTMLRGGATTRGAMCSS